MTEQSDRILDRVELFAQRGNSERAVLAREVLALRARVEELERASDEGGDGAVSDQEQTDE